MISRSSIGLADPPGIAAVYPEDEPAAIVTEDVVRTRVAREAVLPVYLARYLNSEVGKSSVAGITIEATRARFSLGDFKKASFSIPHCHSKNSSPTASPP